MQKQKAGTKKDRKSRSPDVIKEERTFEDASVVPRESPERELSEERPIDPAPEKQEENKEAA